MKLAIPQEASTESIAARKAVAQAYAASDIETHTQSQEMADGSARVQQDALRTAMVDGSARLATQMRTRDAIVAGALQRAGKPAPGENRTGLPDELKSGIESLSGIGMDHVKVHYNSAMPGQLNAHAYAQGSDIHVAPGQERHLPHEAWHVVQQAQGRVRPTKQMKADVAINDDPSLEKEADIMGEKAMQSP